MVVGEDLLGRKMISVNVADVTDILCETWAFEVSGTSTHLTTGYIKTDKYGDITSDGALVIWTERPVIYSVSNDELYISPMKKHLYVPMKKNLYVDIIMENFIALKEETSNILSNFNEDVFDALNSLFDLFSGVDDEDAYDHFVVKK